MYYCDEPVRSWDGSEVYSFCGRSNGSDVDVSFTVWTPSHMDVRTDWDMYLFRKVGGNWVLGGTRSGYVSKDSPSHRTFTDVKKGEIKVEVRPKNSFFYNMEFIIPNH